MAADHNSEEKTLFGSAWIFIRGVPSMEFLPPEGPLEIAFAGRSNVGKSSLINALLPGVDLKVGELSEQTRKGRHTTTTARLFHFPSGGDLIDSPGIREFALWHIEPDALMDGFREFRPYAGLCRFRDCKHRQEPGCALKDALTDGKISESRWASYWHILSSLEEQTKTIRS